MTQLLKPALAAFALCAANSAFALEFNSSQPFTPQTPFIQDDQYDFLSWVSYNTEDSRQHAANDLITGAAYNSIYGANLNFAYGNAALTAFDDGQTVTYLSAYTAFGPFSFSLNGLDAAAFIGGPLFGSSTLTLIGYNGANTVGSFTLDLNANAFQWYDSPLAGQALTRLEIVSAGPGQRWLIDKLDIVPNNYPAGEAPPPLPAVPEPETWPLMLLGVSAAVGRTLSRRRAQTRAGVPA